VFGNINVTFVWNEIQMYIHCIYGIKALGDQIPAL